MSTPITDATIANDPGDSSYITKLVRTCIALEKAANAMEEALRHVMASGYDGPLPDHAIDRASQALAQYRAMKP